MEIQEQGIMLILALTRKKNFNNFQAVTTLIVQCQQFERKQVTILHLKEHSLVK